MKVVAALLCLAAVASARMAYQFSDGYLSILGTEPAQSFDCVGRAYGYYADIPTDCRVYHICLPIAGFYGEIVDTAQFSFVCGNQTVFSQDSLACTHPEEAFPCDQADTIYDSSNAIFGVTHEHETKN